ncbi:MAG: DapH/DapD/GlmU-related protein [Oscillospiraceae bacterium]
MAQTLPLGTMYGLRRTAASQRRSMPWIREQRKAGIEVAKPITIGNCVWIGAGSTILAGVTIGDGAVIGAGSVVTRSIPGNVVAVGVPCKVLREITQEDSRRYPMYENGMG